jgi:hypothetical protein
MPSYSTATLKFFEAAKETEEGRCDPDLLSVLHEYDGFKILMKKSIYIVFKYHFFDPVFQLSKDGERAFLTRLNSRRMRSRTSRYLGDTKNSSKLLLTTPSIGSIITARLDK